MEQVVRSIRLYGNLGAKFGREHKFVVHSPRDALRALGAMVPGFWQELYQSGAHGVRYAVFVGQRNVDDTQLDLLVDTEPIRIAPIIAGSKAGGVFRTIAGVVLAAAGAASMLLFPENPYGINIMLMGGSLALGGIAQMLSPQTPTPARRNQHGMPGIQNVVGQGGPVPLLYGRMRVGSTVISASVKAIDAPASDAKDQSSYEGRSSVVTQPNQSVELKKQNSTPLRSRLICTTVDLISEGEVSGLFNNSDAVYSEWFPLRSVYLDDVVVANFDGTTNFEIDKFDFRKGGIKQSAFEWIDAAEAEVQVGVELKRHLVGVEEDGKHKKVTRFTPWVLEISEPDVNEVDVTVRISDLWYDSNVGHTNTTVKFKCSPTYVPELRDVPNPDPQEKEITGVCDVYYKTYTFPVKITGGSVFKLCFVRTDEIKQNSDAGKMHGTVHVSSYTKRRTGKFKYPSTALAALRINSEKFDRVPVRSYEVKGLLVEVPRNYDPQTRSYDGTWDGSFKRAWTDNPVWIFRDVLLNHRYGAGAWVRPEMVESYALYSIAKYCDELVPSCYGGTEPRFTCNCYITSSSHAFALLQQLASVFRGIAYWSAAHVWGSADMPGDAVYIYNPANVVDGVFKYTGSSLKSRYTAAMVTWCDPLNGFKRAVESVEDAEGIDLYGYNTAEITAFGCTSRGQAQRAGHWLLQTSRLETETVTFSVGLDGALALPGQVIEIADPLRSELSLGGRVHDANDGRIILDRKIETQPGDFLTVVLPDARARRVELSAGSGATVEPVTKLEQNPVHGAAWTVRSASVAPQLYRVVSVSETLEGTSFMITATRHAPQKFAAVDNAAITDEIHHNYIPIEAPTNLKIQALLGADGKMAARVSWDVVDGAKQYHIEWSATGGTVARTSAQGTCGEVMFSGINPGNYTAKVYAEASDSRLSVMVSTSVALPGLLYVKSLSSKRYDAAVVFSADIGVITSVPEYFIELKFGDVSKFSDANGFSKSKLSIPFISVSRQTKGYAWARVRYGVPSGNLNDFDASAWYPDETQPGIEFG